MKGSRRRKNSGLDRQPPIMLRALGLRRQQSKRAIGEGGEEGGETLRGGTTWSAHQMMGGEGVVENKKGKVEKGMEVLKRQKEYTRKEGSVPRREGSNKLSPKMSGKRG